MLSTVVKRTTNTFRTPIFYKAAGRTAVTTAAKKEGDISSVFVSLSGHQAEPLPRRFAELKVRLISGHEDDLRASWHRLLADLREEVDVISALGPNVVPEIQFGDIQNAPENFQRELKKRGVCVVRGVLDQQEALQLKTDLRKYIKDNPQTKAFPQHDPQVYELYFSPSQIRARAHSNLIETQKFLMSFWHSNDPNALISSRHPTAYADRVRIRQPGDSGFALGPHVDGGSVERWEENGYGRGNVYQKIWEGKWETYDPWESSCRVPVVSDLYDGAGACSMLRFFQGWLSMSETGPGEGTLLVNPLLSRATAYYLLRPFFSPRSTFSLGDSKALSFLDSNNWQLDAQPTPTLQGSALSHCQELNDVLHPHLELSKSMVSVPKVQPGDYVAWHCDAIHAVDKVHTGAADASVLYIPTCPLTESNAEYLVRQREAFLSGTTGPDFPGGLGESNHIGRPSAQDLDKVADVEGQRAMGLAKWDANEENLSAGERRVLEKTNTILGYL